MINFKPARTEDSPLILGLAGPSRSGKTYSALRIALGMVDDVSEIFFGDTENGRASQYVPRFGQFMVHNMKPPYSYARYLEVIREARKQGAKVFIADSLSHAHEGKGGMLDQHEAEMQRMAGDNVVKRDKVNYTAWIKPKKELNEFILEIMQLNMPMIFCFRAQQKMKMVKGKGGKTKMVDAGLIPICSERLSFEMSSLLMLPENARGVPDLGEYANGLREPFDQFIKKGVVLDETLGKTLKNWMSEMAASSEPEAVKQAPSDLLDRVKAEAAKGVDHLTEYYSTRLDADEREQLIPHRRELHEIAKKADAE